MGVGKYLTSSIWDIFVGIVGMDRCVHPFYLFLQLNNTNNLINPITINNTPDKTVYVLLGALKCLMNLVAKRRPQDRKSKCSIATKKGKIYGDIPIIVVPTLAHNASIESVKPRYMASLQSIVLELSKSESIGVCVIIHIPIPINNIIPIKQHKNEERILDKMLLKDTDNPTRNIDVTNNIILLVKEILVFFKP